MAINDRQMECETTQWRIGRIWHRQNELGMVQLNRMGYKLVEYGHI